VLRFKGDQVHIGIEAPPDVAVDREEIWVRKQREARGDPAPDDSAVPAPNSPLNSR
jgi:sRNA-binding carbon storage regulator CsrA